MIVLEINDSYIVQISVRVPYPKFYIYFAGEGEGENVAEVKKQVR